MSIWQQRFEQLRQEIPFLFDGDGKTCLYIGATPYRAQGLKELFEAGYEITLLEAFGPFAKHYEGHKFLSQSVHGNVLDLATLFPERKWDVIFWWHGPEHIEKKHLASVLGMLERSAALVVLGCPWGLNRHPKIDNNPYSTHPSTLYPTDFVGYETRTLGRVNDPSTWCHILAWKKGCLD